MREGMKMETNSIKPQNQVQSLQKQRRTIKGQGTLACRYLQVAFTTQFHSHRELYTPDQTK